MQAAQSKGKKLKFEGILATVCTPFTEDGQNVALEGIPKYYRHLTSQGIKGVLVNGTNGEGMSMTVAERKAVLEVWIQVGQADGFHVQVQIGGTNIKDVLTLAKHAEEHGAQSLLCLPELYYKPQTVEELVQYLKIVAEAAPSTPLLYYYSLRTNISLSLTELMVQAGKEIPTFSGVKLGDGDMIRGEACANLDPENNLVFLGVHQVILAAYTVGIKCFNAAATSLFPALCLEIVDAAKKGNLFEAREKQQKLNSTMKTITQFGNNIACFKAASEIVTSVTTGPTRFPVPALDQQTKEKLRQAMEKIGAA